MEASSSGDGTRPPGSGGQPGRRRRRALILGIASGLAVAAAASLLIRWPAPGISAAVGFGVYLLARGPREDAG